MMKTTQEIDLTGVRCPMPIVQLNRLVRDLVPGSEIRAIATDPAFGLDVQAWCRKSGHTLISLQEHEHTFVAVVRSSEQQAED